jgi:hypothetical protein
MTRVFTEALESRLSELCVDSGQLAVAVLPATHFTPDEMAAVNGCCIVLDMDAGDSVACDKVGSRISVTHGSDLRVPEGAEGWLLVLGDPCYFLDGEYGTDEDYGRACAATSGEAGCGFCDLSSGGRAFVSSTVYGDGSYPVRVDSASLSLALSNDDEEDEDEDEDDGWGWDEDDLDTEEDE